MFQVKKYFMINFSVNIFCRNSLAIHALKYSLYIYRKYNILLVRFIQLLFKFPQSVTTCNTTITHYITDMRYSVIAGTTSQRRDQPLKRFY